MRATRMLINATMSVSGHITTSVIRRKRLEITQSVFELSKKS